MAIRDEFQQLAQDLFDTWYRFNPVQASWLGIHAYDDRLADLSLDGIEEHAAVLRELDARLGAVPVRRLPPDLRVDHQAARALFRAGLWSIERAASWRRNPAIYVQEALFGLLVLVGRDFAPIEERAASAVGRLRAIPDLLHAGRVNVTNPPPVFVEIALQAARGGARFVRDAIPRLAEQVPLLREDLLHEAGRAARAMDEFADLLASDTPQGAEGDFAIGRERFEERLRAWHLLSATAHELAGIGRQLFEETSARLREMAAEIEPGRDWPDLIARARREHPPADGLLDAYRQELSRLRAFVLEHDLVSVPEGDRLDVVETPVFERPVVPYAAYMPPAPFEPAQRGEFWVTPVDPAAPPEQQEAQLGEHCNGAYPLTALHEGIPGHHLQLVRANAHPSFTRKHVSSDLFAEGWAFYCEQLLGEHGYYRDPIMRLFQLKDQLWRSARVIIDVGLQLGTMSRREAVSLLVDGVHLAPAQAEGEVRRYCASPTQPLTYAIGKQQILALRAELAGLAPRAFHDRLLSSGTLPFRLVRAEMVDNR